MPYLVDTNVLVRLAHRVDPQRAVAWQAVRTLWDQGERLCYTSQILGPVERGELGLAAIRTASSAA